MKKRTSFSLFGICHSQFSSTPFLVQTSKLFNQNWSSLWDSKKGRCLVSAKYRRSGVPTRDLLSRRSIWLGHKSNNLAYFFIGSYTNNSRSGELLTNSEAGSSYSPDLDLCSNCIDKSLMKYIASCDLQISYFISL